MNEQTRRLLLEGYSQGVVTRCRDFTRRALADWGWTAHSGHDGRPPDPDREEAAEDVLLLVSEMVTNACLHAGGPRELTLLRTPQWLRIEVSDGNPEAPRRRREPDPGRPGGHGLVVLERLARKWGSEAVPEPRGGKTVWAEVPAPPELRSPGRAAADAETTGAAGEAGAGERAGVAEAADRTAGPVATEPVTPPARGPSAARS
ncbi:ATP-binding protein [Streptomyces sp. NPDC012888]|uniref:ATP-binding protein n=1 Tax=Streptomyces sp. NPDC012888 TaxID=3364855 RepID=UPI0036AF0374